MQYTFIFLHMGSYICRPSETQADPSKGQGPEQSSDGQVAPEVTHKCTQIL